jgi:hypothetical protein
MTQPRPYKRWLLSLTAIVFFEISAAQVPVGNEAHHKVVFENDYVRILEGNVPAHDTTPPHIHAANSVVVFLSVSTFGIGIDGEKPLISSVTPGDTRIVDYSRKPVTHIVWNQSEGIFHFLVVELKHPQQGPVKPKYLDLTKGVACHLPASPHARVLVAITNTPPGLRPGGFLFISPQSEFNIDGEDGGRLLLLELD